MQRTDGAVRLLWAAAALALALASLAPPASAQPWEFVYGPTGSRDQGNRRVAPVRYCGAGGGYVAVGTTTPTTSTNSNVYFVRTAASGAPVLELQYDLGPGFVDSGESIVELRDGSGFVIAGATRPSATVTSDAFLLKISCTGGIVWLNLYASSLNEGAFDVIEAASGDTAFGTAAGDLVVAGIATNPSGDSDAMLFRTRANGNLLWNRRYDVGHASEYFHALTETRPTVSPAGDIVAVGSFTAPVTPANEQAYAVRVSGNTGLIGAAPQCAATIGGPDAERFESVTDVRYTAALAGQLVMAGVTSSTASSNDVFMVRTQANPCVMLQERRIGDPAGGPYGDEYAFDVKEVAAALAIAPVGRLALTGYAGKAATSVADNDAFLLIADQTSLAPIAGTGRLYGDHATRQEVGVSIFPHATGFVIAGLNDADPQAVGDPRDLYLVNADTNGKTSCEIAWNPPSSVPAFPYPSVSPAAVTFLTQSPKTASIIQQSTPYQVCP